MSEDELVEYLSGFGPIRHDIPSNFKSKEFIIKLINKSNCCFCVDVLFHSDICVDYDVILATQMNDPFDYDYSVLKVSYSHYLSDDEINKLWTTLELMK